MTNTTTTAPRRSGRAGDPSAAPVHGAALSAERALSIADEETLALDGLVIDIEQLGAFDIGKRTPPASE
jgi:hypothetical protein